MKEIAEGAAELINPYDPKDIANAIKKILNDKSYQKELIEKGLKKAQQFSLKKMGQAYLNLLKSLL
jgi:glycosyltransferase involved in cell wall biosynthesis